MRHVLPVALLAVCLLPETGCARADKPSPEADREYMRAMESMHGTPVMHGDADQDFVAMMLPHHQAAIDMAKTELKYGTDPELRTLAESIITTQQAEIERMSSWQNRPR